MTYKLTADERSFFTLVRQAVTANPFSAERQALDLKIAGRYAKHNPSDTVDEAVKEVGMHIGKLSERHHADIDSFSGEERKLVENAVLFYAFHQFIPQLDRLITDQMAAAAPEPPLTVPFAADMVTFLHEFGFTVDASFHCFELFFQLRRAFFFIQQNLVGRSPCMVKLRESLWNNVFTHDIDLFREHLWNRMEDFSTLILGPTGAGKGTAAAAIGRSGYIPFDRKKNCFVENFTRAFTSINLSQFSETLIESELFGHKKGAFTGAIENYQGVLDRCSPYGAILLDEIGDVSRPIQIKLLQVLQERGFAAVGDHRVKRFSGRVIAATNRPWDQIGEGQLLRDDFSYRLCSDMITVPGLSQRVAEDSRELSDLVHHTVERILGKPLPELANKLHRQLLEQLGQAYPWPGNVRELEQSVRRLLISGRYAPFQKQGDRALAGQLQHGIASGQWDAQTLLQGYCFLLYQRHGTYEKVAQCTRLDRRTAKKYVEAGGKQFG